MKKLLIATAALAMVAGTAQAQSSVTVYGVIDTGYNSLENTTAAGVKTETSGIVANAGEGASSRLGFRGTEDLGGGLKANFVLESGIAQNTALTFGNRGFWVGLQDAKMGELRVGRQDTFTRTNWLAHDQLAFANVVGNLAHSQAGVANGSGSSNAAVGALNDRSVAINYLSPRMSGVQLSLGVSQLDVEKTAANKTKTDTGSQIGLNYVAGKFSAGVAYVESTTSVNTAAGTGLFASTVDQTTLGAPAVTAADTKTKDTSAAASYDLGVAKVAYIYNKRDGADSLSTTSTGNLDRTSHSFSASIPLSAKLIGRVGYGFGEYRQGAATNYNGDIKGMQAALNYNLSKRTMVYGIYGDESREISASTKAKNKEYSVGVRHSF